MNHLSIKSYFNKTSHGTNKAELISMQHKFNNTISSMFSFVNYDFPQEATVRH
jgi:hypothetical protein